MDWARRVWVGCTHWAAHPFPWLMGPPGRGGACLCVCVFLCAREKREERPGHVVYEAILEKDLALVFEFCVNGLWNSNMKWSFTSFNEGCPPFFSIFCQEIISYNVAQRSGKTMPMPYVPSLVQHYGRDYSMESNLLVIWRQYVKFKIRINAFLSCVSSVWPLHNLQLWLCLWCMCVDVIQVMLKGFKWLPDSCNGSGPTGRAC